jgi:hypothetical protein
VSVSATCDDLELLRKAVLIAERACQVVNTLKLAAPVRVAVPQNQPANLKGLQSDGKVMSD